MKIYSVSTVKNESDVVESFVRYNYSYLDGMVIINHDSHDKTGEILENLRNEGYNIKHIKSHDFSHHQGDIISQNIKDIIHDENPDLIIPLDADEFLRSRFNDNPREVLYKLDLNHVYYIKWETYVPCEKITPGVFIPKYMNFRRTSDLETFYKIIIPSKIYEKNNLKIQDGNHECSVLSSELKKNLDVLSMAHFPVRSKDQLLSKVLIGWLNVKSRPNLPKNHSWHWNELYRKAVNNYEINIKDYAIDYACNEPAVDRNLIEDPINFDFCNDISIKYGDLSGIDVKTNVLKNANSLASELSRTMEKNKL